jgi:RNA polymerase sigma factor (sigma-70 family)
MYWQHPRMDVGKIDPKYKDMALVWSVAIKYYHAWEGKLPGGLELADLVQSGYLVLDDCLKGFDKSLNNTFATYLHKALRRHFRTMISHHQNAIHVATNAESLVRLIQNGDDREYTPQEMKRADKAFRVKKLQRCELCDYSKTVSSNNHWVDKEALHYYLDLLPDKLNKLIKSHFGIDCPAMTLDEIAKSLLFWDRVVSRENVRQTIEKGLKILREYMT